MADHKLEELYHKGELTWQDGEFIVERGFQWTPPGCHNSCGMLYYMKDGKLDHAEGDPLFSYNKGRLCSRCLNLVEAAYNEERLKYPMVRDRKNRGNKDAWRRVSWDEALDIIDEYVKTEIDGKGYGRQTIFGMVGTGRNICWQVPWIINNAFGSPNTFCALFSGDSCAVPRTAATVAIMGGYPVSDMGQFNEQMMDYPDFTPPGTILIWGANPLKSNADCFQGFWMTDCYKKGSKFVVVDPMINWMSAKAEVQIQIRPGTDAAVAMAMNHVIIEEDLYDHEFVEEWCFGFEEWSEQVKECTPEWAAEIAWCDADDIRRAARVIATNGACAAPFGVSNDQKRNGVSAYQSIFNMLALTGNYENPGGNTIAYDPWGTVMSYVAGWDEGVLTDEMKAKRLGDSEFPLHSVGFSALGQGDVLLKALETGLPEMRMSFAMGTNPIVNMAPDAPRVYNALMKVPFAICCDYRMTPYIEGLCDMVLPIGMSWERNTIRCWFTPMRASRKISQYYECKSDEEIVALFLQRFNKEWADSKGIVDDISMMEYIIDSAPNKTFDYKTLLAGQADGKNYEWPDRPYGQHEKGMLRPDGQPGFATTTGKIELDCTMFAMLGLPSMPFYEEPFESPVSRPDLFEKYPLVLTTGARNFEFFHSEQREQKHMRSFYPNPRLRINPADAKKYGIEDGQWVWIENDRGRCRQVAMVMEGMMEGVIEGDHGWWFPEQEANAPSLFGTFNSNINNLTENGNPGCYSFGADFRSTLAKVYPCTPENSGVMPGEQVVELGGFKEPEYTNPTIAAYNGHTWANPPASEVPAGGYPVGAAAAPSAASAENAPAADTVVAGA